MRYLQLVTLAVIVISCASTKSTLEDVASKVPAVIQCVPNKAAATDLLVRYFANNGADQDLIEKGLADRVKNGEAAAVVCQLLDAQAVLLEQGKRFDPVYEKIAKAIADLLKKTQA